MKRITILAAAGALVATPAFGVWAADAATSAATAPHVRSTERHGEPEPGDHARHRHADDRVRHHWRGDDVVGHHRHPELEPGDDRRGVPEAEPGDDRGDHHGADDGDHHGPDDGGRHGGDDG